MEYYQDKANMVIVYTIDAHPSDTLSPYAQNDQPWIPPNNRCNQIETPQPRTNGERVELTKTWKAENDISAPFWSTILTTRFRMFSGKHPTCATCFATVALLSTVKRGSMDRSLNGSWIGLGNERASTWALHDGKIANYVILTLLF